MRLNYEIVTEDMLVDMFRRKSVADIEGEICPYCEFVNDIGATTCSQCYYDLNKAPRDQGEPITDEMSNSIFDELMSDEDDSWEDSEALDVVLTLDQDPLEVDQYETTNFDSEEPEKIGFMSSSSPELHNTVNHEPEEITTDDLGEAIEGVEKLDFSKTDPFDEVPDPVHQGKGTVFSPNSPSKMDDDLLGHVGGSELPSLPPDDLYDNKVDFTAKAPAPTPAVALPSIPVVENVESNVEPNPPAIVLPENHITPTPIDPEAVTEVATPEIEMETENVQEPEVGPEVEPEVTDVIEAPVPQIPTRIWPWAASEPWDPRQVHREVVLALEQVKSGKVDEAANTIDSLGPHLSQENVDLIYHIGMVLKQLGRIDEVKTMLYSANVLLPGNEHVSSAVAYLGV